MNDILKRFLSPAPVLPHKGIALLRWVFGLLLIYHGQEVFNPELMKSYTEWDTFRGSYAYLLVYAGKSAELFAGISIFLGLFTRVGSLLCIGALSYVTFVVGQGRFWYEDQHPFMFVLFGLLFLVNGPGAWSLDALLFKSNSSRNS